MLLEEALDGMGKTEDATKELEAATPKKGDYEKGRL
jgi:hypothetical protein